MPMKRINEIHQILNHNPALEILRTFEQISQNIQPLQSALDKLNCANYTVNQDILNMINRHQEIINNFPTFDFDISKLAGYPSLSKEFTKTSLDIINIIKDYDLPEDIEESKENVVEITEQESSLSLLQFSIVIALILSIVSFIQNNQPNEDFMNINSSISQLFEQQNLIMTSILNEKLSEIIQKQQDFLNSMQSTNDISSEQESSNFQKEFSKTFSDIINVLDDYSLSKNINESKQIFIIKLEQESKFDLGQAVSLIELIGIMVGFIVRLYSKQKSSSDDPALNKMVENQNQIIKQNSEIIELLKKQHTN